MRWSIPLLFMGLAAAASSGAVESGEVRAGEVVTFAGNGKPEYTGDGGPATVAGVGGPFGIAIGPEGALHVCETTSHVVRRIDETGIATTVAGTGEKGYAGDGGPANRAKLNEPYEVRFDDAGHMFFVEMRNHVVRRVDAKTGIVSTVAGTGEAGFSGDGGPAKQATLSGPKGASVDPATGDLYIADTESHTIRVIRAKTGVIETVVGDGERGNGPDGDPRKCRLDRPHGVYFHDAPAHPALYIGDSSNNVVRRLTIERGN